MAEETFSYHLTLNDQREIDLNSDQVEDLDLIPSGKDLYHLLENGNSYRIKILDFQPDQSTVKLKVNGRIFSIQAETPLQRKIHALGIDQDEGDGSEDILAPMPGKVLSIQVEEGENVESGQDILILEAMKMENVLKAGTAGMVTKVAVAEGDAVEKNAFLLNISGE